MKGRSSLDGHSKKKIPFEYLSFLYPFYPTNPGSLFFDVYICPLFQDDNVFVPSVHPRLEGPPVSFFPYTRQWFKYRKNSLGKWCWLKSRKK